MERCKRKCAGPNPITPSSRFKISRRLLEQSRQWVVTALSYGTALAVGVSYFCEWKTVLQYVPYYNWGYMEKTYSPPKSLEDTSPVPKPNKKSNGSNMNEEANGALPNEEPPPDSGPQQEESKS